MFSSHLKLTGSTLYSVHVNIAGIQSVQPYHSVEVTSLCYYFLFDRLFKKYILPMVQFAG